MLLQSIYSFISKWVKSLFHFCSEIGLIETVCCCICNHKNAERWYFEKSCGLTSTKCWYWDFLQLLDTGLHHCWLMNVNLGLSLMLMSRNLNLWNYCLAVLSSTVLSPFMLQISLTTAQALNSFFQEWFRMTWKITLLSDIFKSTDLMMM